MMDLKSETLKNKFFLPIDVLNCLRYLYAFPLVYRERYIVFLVAN